MCVAIYIPPKGNITRDRLFECYTANPDGFGLMWSTDNELRIHKEVSDFERFYTYFLILYKTGRNFVVHFRTASSGSISDENCHPFLVNNCLGFVENGNLYEFTNYFYRQRFDGQTDIMRFCQDILQCLPHNFLHRSDIRNALEQYCISNYTKMVFMENTGHVEIINETSGEWVDGCWYSNGGIKNYTGYGYSGAYEYKSDDCKHKGGMISQWLFPAGRRSNWFKCRECNGWFDNGHLVFRPKLGKIVCNNCKIYLDLKVYCQ